MLHPKHFPLELLLDFQEPPTIKHRTLVTEGKMASPSSLERDGENTCKHMHALLQMGFVR